MFSCATRAFCPGRSQLCLPSWKSEEACQCTLDTSNYHIFETSAHPHTMTINPAESRDPPFRLAFAVWQKSGLNQHVYFTASWKLLDLPGFRSKNLLSGRKRKDKEIHGKAKQGTRERRQKREGRVEEGGEGKDFNWWLSWFGLCGYTNASALPRETEKHFQKQRRWGEYHSPWQAWACDCLNWLHNHSSWVTEVQAFWPSQQTHHTGASWLHSWDISPLPQGQKWVVKWTDVSSKKQQIH